MVNQRPKGTVIYKSPENKNVLAAKQMLKAKADRLAADRARKAAIPVPNRICYAESAFKNWKVGDKIPPCRVCGELLHPNENHVCSGFVPKYVEHDDAWHERQDAKREAILESREMMRGVFCSVCGDLMEDESDGQWHWEDHEGKSERNHYAINGDEDDPTGYEDEPEEDWCDEDGDPDCE